MNRMKKILVVKRKRGGSDSDLSEYPDEWARQKAAWNKDYLEEIGVLRDRNDRDFERDKSTIEEFTFSTKSITERYSATVVSRKIEEKDEEAKLDHARIVDGRLVKLDDVLQEEEPEDMEESDDDFYDALYAANTEAEDQILGIDKELERDMISDGILLQIYEEGAKEIIKEEMTKEVTKRTCPVCRLCKKDIGYPVRLKPELLDCNCSENVCLQCLRDYLILNDRALDIPATFSCYVCEKELRYRPYQIIKKSATDIYVKDHCLAVQLDTEFGPIKCPRGCGVEYLRQDASNHYAICDSTPRFAR